LGKINIATRGKEEEKGALMIQKNIRRKVARKEWVRKEGYTKKRRQHAPEERKRKEQQEYIGESKNERGEGSGKIRRHEGGKGRKSVISQKFTGGRSIRRREISEKRTNRAKE